MSFIDGVKQRAKSNIKTIALPEATDKRVLEAANKITREGFAKVILIGNKILIEKKAKEHNISIEGISIVNPIESAKYEEYANTLYELRKAKGMTEEQAHELMKDETHFGMMMVKMGACDGLVSGAIHSSSDTLRPALQILKTAPDTKLVSAFFLMVIPNCEYGENGVFVFSDCGLNQSPNSDELAEIAISSSKSFEQLVGKTPKVAMLSYSTYGSAKSELVDKVQDATKLVKEKAPKLLVDGELQLDAAIIPEIAASKAKEVMLQERQIY